MSTGWTAPGSSTTSRPDPAPAEPPSGSPTQGAPSPGPGPRRELVQELPLFPLRPLTLGEVLGAAVRIYRRRAKPMLGLSAVVNGIAYVLITIGTGATMIPFIGQTRAALEDPAAGSTLTVTSLSEFLTVMGTSLLTGLVSMVAAATVTAVLTRITIGEATGEPLPSSQLWPTFRRLALPAIGVAAVVAALTLVAFALPVALGMVPLLVWQDANALTVLALGLGLLLGLVATVYVYARTLLAVPALVVEGTGVLGAVRRSFALTAGRRLWRVLGVGTLLLLLYYVAVQVIAGVFGTIGAVVYLVILLATSLEGVVIGVLALTVISMIGGYIATFLLAPYVSAGTAAIYADARMRHEAWDIDLNRRFREARSGHGTQDAS